MLARGGAVSAAETRLACGSGWKEPPQQLQHPMERLTRVAQHVVAGAPAGGVESLSRSSLSPASQGVTLVMCLHAQPHLEAWPKRVHFLQFI